MKRLIALIICVLTLSTTAYGQLVFEKASHDFGKIRETDGPVSCTFRGRNDGSKPVVLLDVVTTCGCTVPQFSRKPLLPGEQTEITVTYDPANRPGHFRRELEVYSSGRKKIATLEIRGSVTPREKRIDELYPVDAGGGLRLQSTLCALTYLRVGLRTQSAVGYVNASERSITVALRRTEPSGIITVTMPRTIAPGERGTIDIVGLNPREAPRYGTVKEAVAFDVDGHESDVRLLIHGYAVDNPTDSRGKEHPAVQISENFLKFGVVKHRAPVQRRTLTLESTGDADLVIRAVESDNEAVRLVLDAGQRIRAGERLEAEVLLDPRLPDFGTLSTYVTVITNDLERPMRRIRITAIIEN